MDLEPTEVTFLIISGWNANDFHGLMEFIKPYWKYADCGYWRQLGDVYHISTAGWSDNEEIIFYMMQNHIWWMMYWWQSQRGGHYIFRPMRDGIGNLLVYDDPAKIEESER
jgi:hypothetical protein